MEATSFQGLIPISPQLLLHVKKLAYLDGAFNTLAIISGVATIGCAVWPASAPLPAKHAEHVYHAGSAARSGATSPQLQAEHAELVLHAGHVEASDKLPCVEAALKLPCVEAALKLPCIEAASKLPCIEAALKPPSKQAECLQNAEHAHRAGTLVADVCPAVHAEPVGTKKHAEPVGAKEHAEPVGAKEHAYTWTEKDDANTMIREEKYVSISGKAEEVCPAVSEQEAASKKLCENGNDANTLTKRPEEDADTLDAEEQEEEEEDDTLATAQADADALATEQAVADALATEEEDAGTLATEDGEDAGTLATEEEEDAGTLATEEEEDAGTLATEEEEDAGTLATEEEEDAGTLATEEEEDAGTLATDGEDAGTLATEEEDAGTLATEGEEDAGTLTTDGEDAGTLATEEAVALPRAPHLLHAATALRPLLAAIALAALRESRATTTSKAPSLAKAPQHISSKAPSLAKSLQHLSSKAPAAAATENQRSKQYRSLGLTPASTPASTRSAGTAVVVAAAAAAQAQAPALDAGSPLWVAAATAATAVPACEKQLQGTLQVPLLLCAHQEGSTSTSTSASTSGAVLFSRITQSPPNNQTWPSSTAPSLSHIFGCQQTLTPTTWATAPINESLQSNPSFSLSNSPQLNATHVTESTLGATALSPIHPLNPSIAAPTTESLHAKNNLAFSLSDSYRNTAPQLNTSRILESNLGATALSPFLSLTPSITTPANQSQPMDLYNSKPAFPLSDSSQFDITPARASTSGTNALSPILAPEERLSPFNPLPVPAQTKPAPLSPFNPLGLERPPTNKLSPFDLSFSLPSSLNQQAKQPPLPHTPVLSSINAPSPSTPPSLSHTEREGGVVAHTNKQNTNSAIRSAPSGTAHSLFSSLTHHNLAPANKAPASSSPLSLFSSPNQHTAAPANDSFQSNSASSLLSWLTQQHALTPIKPSSFTTSAPLTQQVTPPPRDTPPSNPALSLLQRSQEQPVPAIHPSPVSTSHSLLDSLNLQAPAPPHKPERFPNMHTQPLTTAEALFGPMAQHYITSPMAQPASVITPDPLPPSTLPLPSTPPPSASDPRPRGRARRHGSFVTVPLAPANTFQAASNTAPVGGRPRRHGSFILADGLSWEEDGMMATGSGRKGLPRTANRESSTGNLVGGTAKQCESNPGQTASTIDKIGSNLVSYQEVIQSAGEGGSTVTKAGSTNAGEGGNAVSKAGSTNAGEGSSSVNTVGSTIASQGGRTVDEAGNTLGGKAGSTVNLTGSTVNQPGGTVTQPGITSLASFFMLNSQTNSGDLVPPSSSAASFVTPNSSAANVVTPNSSAASFVTPNSSAANVVTPNASAANVVAPNACAANVVTPNVSAAYIVTPNASSAYVVTPITSAANVVTPNTSAAKLILPKFPGSSTTAVPQALFGSTAAPPDSRNVLAYLKSFLQDPHAPKEFGAGPGLLLSTGSSTEAGSSTTIVLPASLQGGLGAGPASPPNTGSSTKACGGTAAVPPCIGPSSSATGLNSLTWVQVGTMEFERAKRKRAELDDAADGKISHPHNTENRGGGSGTGAGTIADMAAIDGGTRARTGAGAGTITDIGTAFGAVSGTGAVSVTNTGKGFGAGNGIGAVSVTDAGKGCGDGFGTGANYAGTSAGAGVGAGAGSVDGSGAGKRGSIPVNTRYSKFPAPRGLGVQIDVAPSQQEQRADVAPGQQGQRADVAPGQQEHRADVAPGQQEQRADVAAGQHEQRADVASGQQEQRGDVAPSQQEQRADVAPSQQEQRTDVAPGQQEQRADVASGQQEQRADVAPGQQEQRADVAPSQQEQRADVAAGQQGERSAPQLYSHPEDPVFGDEVQGRMARKMKDDLLCALASKTEGLKVNQVPIRKDVRTFFSQPANRIVVVNGERKLWWGSCLEANLIKGLITTYPHLFMVAGEASKARVYLVHEVMAEMQGVLKRMRS